ncbi:uncharacterized protein LOC142974212 [Anticarsia gemmatalis]|uniref:uncharacterized protein LOC142974212 n=1 Tax=Anticarsia gemmatalis TaxID=129554 RepID=UPI003F75D692
MNSNAKVATYVQVKQGLLAGQILDLVTGEGQYHSFKGIPYAQPPVGELRFKAPVAASAWDGVRDATEHGSVCPQNEILTNILIPGDEDCLFLNVYSPNVTSHACLPVVFFIHGGGFKSGSGNVDSFGPDFFMRKYIVLVTINYRLDALGFLSLGTKEVPGNAGLKDQVLALKWVQQNIKYFGGDPTKVTIMGQSAGGASVGFHLASPMSTGLFHRAIALSGSPYCDWVLPYHPKTRAFKLGKQFGYETQNTNALLSFLQTVSSDQFVNYANPYVLASEEITSVLIKLYQFPPVEEKFGGENNFMSENLLNTNFRYVNKADLLFGYTNQEAVTLLAYIKSVLLPRYDAFYEMFASRKVADNYAPDIVLKVGAKVRDHYFENKNISVENIMEFLDYVNDATFKYDIVRYFSKFPNNGKKYMYQFSSESSRNEYGSQGAQYGIFGAGHIDDLSNLFDPKSRNLTLDMNSNEFQIIDKFTTLMANFIKCGSLLLRSIALNNETTTWATTCVGGINLYHSQIVGTESSVSIPAPKGGRLDWPTAFRYFISTVTLNYSTIRMDITITLIIIFAFAAQCSAVDSIQLQVPQGTLAGELLELLTGDGHYYSFKGIPYAQPPVGELRFKAPRPAVSWEGVRNASQHGSVCPQQDILTEVFIPGDEDCLFLNVYSPNVTSEARLPVLFFIHGGGFKSGSGNVDSFGPDFFMRKDIVLVTINYRLDALGFLSLGTEEVPGNAGLKDQVLALKWVQQNIKYFGGDPTKVTIMGQSAGGASVGFHLASPMSTGLFHRAIALSGSPYCDWAISYRPETRAFKLGKQLGYETKNTSALLSFLQTLSSDKFVNYTDPNVLASEELTSVTTKQSQFLPVIEQFFGENNFISENLLNTNFSHVNNVDLLFSYTNQEGITLLAYIKSVLLARYDAFIEMFSPRKVANNYAPDVVLKVGAKIRDHYFGNKSISEETMKEFVNYVSETSFKYDILRYYSKIPNDRKKYMFLFSSESSRNEYGSQGAPYGIFGAGHLDDLSYLFDPKSRNLTLDMTSNEFQVIDTFTTLIANFIKCGNPTPDSSFNVTWPEFDSTSMNYMDIGTNDMTVSSLTDESYYKFFETLFESLGLIY